MKQVIQACQDKATTLDGMFPKLSIRERYLSAVRILGKGNEVETLIKRRLRLMISQLALLLAARHIDAKEAAFGDIPV